MPPLGKVGKNLLCIVPIGDGASIPKSIIILGVPTIAIENIGVVEYLYSLL